VAFVAGGAAYGVAFVAGGAAYGVAFVVYGVAYGVAGGVAVGVADHKIAYPLGRQIGGILIGIVVGSVTQAVMGGLAFLVGGVAVEMAYGVAYGAAYGVAVGLRTKKIADGVAYAVMGGVTVGGIMVVILIGATVGLMASGIVVAMVGVIVVSAFVGSITSIFFAFPYVITERIAGAPAGAVAGALSNMGWWMAILVVSNTENAQIISIAIAISTLLGLTWAWWRPVALYPLLLAANTLLYQAELRRSPSKSSLLRWHPAFWDEHQRLPILSLEEHIVLVAKRNPTEGQAVIDYFSTSRQRRAAQAAQIELDAWNLERCANVVGIRNIHQKLTSREIESPISNLLNIFSRISEDVDAALNQRSNYNQRLAMKAVIDRLNANLQDLIRSSDKYSKRFYPIAKSWHKIITDYVEELAKEVELRQEIDSPYILAVPLTQEQEIFSGRNDIGTRIEQLILDRRRPPLLLYGQRRMGKTSLLNNLGKLLPNSIIPMFVDLQGSPSSANNYTGFLYNLARGMITSAKKEAVTLPPLTRETLANDPFTCFDEWLDKVEEVLEQNTALLMLDEFEVLDSAITKGRFDEQDVLGMLRHLIQHRPRFKLMLAGSHTIEEYQRWASYLINVQVLHISYLKVEEARKLIEHPVKDFTLRYEPDAIERILQITRCHPFLVQLLCSEIVAYKNEQDPSVRRLATLEDVEAGMTEALSTGSFFFADIQNNQVDAVGLNILRLIAAQGEEAIVSKNIIFQQLANVSESACKQLLQRELIEEVGDGYRFQVELIRRWFAVRNR
jgi:hypothetical protein